MPVHPRAAEEREPSGVCTRCLLEAHETCHAPLRASSICNAGSRPPYESDAVHAATIERVIHEAAGSEPLTYSRDPFKHLLQKHAAAYVTTRTTARREPQSDISAGSRSGSVTKLHARWPPPQTRSHTSAHICVRLCVSRACPSSETLTAASLRAPLCS